MIAIVCRTSDLHPWDCDSPLCCHCRNEHDPSTCCLCWDSQDPEHEAPGMLATEAAQRVYAEALEQQQPITDRDPGDEAERA